jgi:NAD(P)-dependent dehydrogenase (short-subunit alcohol dehydrogenase family)
MESDVQGRRRLEDKVAVVIGASRGIGAAVARAFVHAGASVALAARDGGALAALAGELTNSSDAGNQAVLTVPTEPCHAREKPWDASPRGFKSHSLRAGDGCPAHAGLAVPAQVPVGHPIGGLGQLRARNR